MSFPRYAEYKDSGVDWLGEVPAHWGVKRLRFVADLNPSKSELSSRDRAEEVSFVPMEAIGDDGSLNLDRTRPIGEVETGYTYFRDGDVTVAKITPYFENGKGAVMRGLVSGFGFGTTELVVARPKATETTSEYLHWLFISRPFRQLGEAAMYGAGGQKRVPDEFVRNFAVAFPDVAEQTAIASFLDRETAKIDALVAEQKKLIALLKEKRQAVISHAVTKGLNPDVPMKDSGIEWLGDVPAHWDVSRLKFVARIQTGVAKGKDNTGKDTLSVPYLRVANVQDGYLDLEDIATIEGRKPNFYLSASVAESTNEQAAYTRNKGLEKERLKQFVLSHLRQFQPTSREDLDNLLMPMLPAGLTEQQKRDKVKNLLTEMRAKDGTVYSEGRGPAAVWRVQSGVG